MSPDSNFAQSKENLWNKIGKILKTTWKSFLKGMMEKWNDELCTIYNIPLFQHSKCLNKKIISKHSMPS